MISHECWMWWLLASPVVNRNGRMLTGGSVWESVSDIAAVALEGQKVQSHTDRDKHRETEINKHTHKDAPAQTETSRDRRRQGEDRLTQTWTDGGRQTQTSTERPRRTQTDRHRLTRTYGQPDCTCPRPCFEPRLRTRIRRGSDATHMVAGHAPGSQSLAEGAIPR